MMDPNQRLLQKLRLRRPVRVFHHAAAAGLILDLVGVEVHLLVSARRRPPKVVRNFVARYSLIKDWFDTMRNFRQHPLL